ncbi:hypothetical protein ACIRP7_13380 [Streptomyces sp. NPDC102270]|uniref:hypothetical protein n=1 Tax=Streptomyces sp. NPDC102270 TaxID=3366150 RepID=UPI0038036157
MGIRMLHRRAGPGRTQAQAHADRAPSGRRSPVPAHATAASTARIPFDLVTLLRRTRGRVRLTTLRHAATELRHRVDRRERDAALWAELALSYLALALTLLPRSRPMPPMTVFIAAVDAVSERAGDRPLPGRRTPGPGATA